MFNEDVQNMSYNPSAESLDKSNPENSFETEESMSDIEDPVGDPSLQAALADSNYTTTTTLLYENPSLAQIPKLEVIAEHEILETPAFPSALSPTIPQQPVAPLLVGADSEMIQSHVAGEVQPIFSLCTDESEQGLSESTITDMPSRKGSWCRPDNAAELETSHPLLLFTRVNNSEPTLPKVPTEQENMGIIKRMGNYVGRRFFASTALTPSDSLQSLEFGISGVNYPMFGPRFFQRRIFSSRNSISSDASGMPATSSLCGRSAENPRGFLSRSHSRQRGDRVSRSKRFITRGTAGFLHAKGTSAISLRPPDESNGLPSPCGECPYCRKFLRSGDAVTLQFRGACPCRICTIINEGTTGGPPLLKLQTAKKVSVNSQQTGGGGMARVPSEVGMFCEHCNQAGFIPPDGRCTRFSPALPVQATVLVDRLTNQVPSSADTSFESLVIAGNQLKTSRDMSVLGAIQHISSRISLNSLATANNDPLCRICHSTADTDDALMSPCRCTGTLQFVHMSCLVHWLDISSRKLRKPPICELCHYRYKRHKVLKWNSLHWPSCRKRDKFFHWLFIFSVLIMLISAIATIVCFQLEKKYGRYGQTMLKIKNTKSPNLLEEQRQMNQMIEAVTMIAGVLFFVGFFVAMYAQIKAQMTIVKYISRCWQANHEWVVNEYIPAKDVEYSRKLEELRKRTRKKTSSQQQRSSRRRSESDDSLASDGPNWMVEQEENSQNAAAASEHMPA